MLPLGCSYGHNSNNFKIIIFFHSSFHSIYISLEVTVIPPFQERSVMVRDGSEIIYKATKETTMDIELCMRI